MFGGFRLPQILTKVGYNLTPICSVAPNKSVKRPVNLAEPLYLFTDS